MKQIEPQQGGDRKSKGRDRPNGRAAAAEEAGLSERQRKTAIRVANIDEQSVNEQIEDDAPPTVTQLAEQGTRKLVDIGDSSPANFALATEAIAS